MKFKNDWNNRVLISDNQEEIHQDFEEMLNPDFTKGLTDDLAEAFVSEVDDSFLPEFDLLHAKCGEETCDIVKTALEMDNPIAVAHIDDKMSSDMDGIETAHRVREIDKNIEIVLMTAYTNKSCAQIARGMELSHKLLYIRKPFAREEIQQMTFSLAEKWNVERELVEKRRQLAISSYGLAAVLASSAKSGRLVPNHRNIMKIR